MRTNASSAGSAAIGRRPSARERVLDAAYALFSAQSVAEVGIDSIISRADVAKMSFYKHFASKEDLILAFLVLRDERWSKGWLQAEVARRDTTPKDQLLAIFDALDRWFRTTDFAGCPLVRTAVDTPRNTRIHSGAKRALGNLHAYVKKLATVANLGEPEKFASIWTVLMKGSIVSAVEGDRGIARQTKQAAGLILDRWPRSARATGARKKAAVR